jgi:hypothetical protein
MQPSADNAYFADHAELLLDSYERLLRVPLIPHGGRLLHAPLIPHGGRLLHAPLPLHGERMQRAKALYESPVVVVSHDTRTDPVFNYANLAAQQLFELDWDGFVALPSRLSAGPVHREERQRLLAIVTRQGYIDDYSGIRVAASGRQFRIAQATVWNLTRADGTYAGQAACFSRWDYF